MKLSQALKITAIIGWVVLITFFVYAFRHHLINFHMVRQFSEHLGWKAGLVYVIAYALRPFVFFPASIMTSLAAVLFGPLIGWGYAFLAENLSAMVTFFAARYLGRNFIAKSSNEFLKKYDTQLTTRGFDTVLFLRLVPVFPFDFVNLASGLSGITFRQYFLATIPGLIPGLTAYVLLGGALHHRHLFFFSLVCFALVYWLSNLYRSKRKVERVY